MKQLLTSIILLFSNIYVSNAQNLPFRKKTDNQKSYYARLWNLHQLTRSSNAIAFPITSVNNNGYLRQQLFEANITPYFTITRGRDNNKAWFRKFETFIHFNNILRMYRIQDNLVDDLPSLPVWPTNFVGEVGCTYFLNKAPQQDIEHVGDFSFIEGIVAHYSNGQNESHFIKDSFIAGGFPAPNYQTGNFSTNYAKLAFVYGKEFNAKNSYLLNKVYIQKDGRFGGAFEYDKDQLNSYGKWFLGYECTATLGTTINKKSKASAAYYSLVASYKGRAILDNVDKYQARNNGNANRLMHTISLQLQPMNYRNIGFLAEYYQGRDYYNIRFYDYIRQFKVGITANLLYFMPTKAFYRF